MAVESNTKFAGPAIPVRTTPGSQRKIFNTFGVTGCVPRCEHSLAHLLEHGSEKDSTAI